MSKITVFVNIDLFCLVRRQVKNIEVLRYFKVRRNGLTWNNEKHKKSHEQKVERALRKLKLKMK